MAAMELSQSELDAIFDSQDTPVIFGNGNTWAKNKGGRVDTLVYKGSEKTITWTREPGQQWCEPIIVNAN